MFNDGRSKKVIVVVHCVLNQNARMDPYARHKGAVTEIVEYLMDKDYGILQIPCPEFLYMGLLRERRTKELPEVWHVLSTPEGRAKCREIALQTTMQIKQYLDNGFHVAAVIGKNQSPSCGVEETTIGDKVLEGPGIFIQELKKVFEEHSITIPVVACPQGENESLGILDWLKENVR